MQGLTEITWDSALLLVLVKGNCGENQKNIAGSQLMLKLSPHKNIYIKQQTVPANFVNTHLQQKEESTDSSFCSLTSAITGLQTDSHSANSCDSKSVKEKIKMHKFKASIIENSDSICN